MACDRSLGGKRLNHISSYLLIYYQSTHERKNAEGVKPVGEFFQDGDGMNATCLITRKLAEVSAGVNAVLKYGDPDHFREASLLREKLREAIPSYNNLSTEDLLIYEGRQFLYNCHTAQHTDRQDPPKSYAVLAGFGSFRGGHFRFPTLGLRARMGPGDAIALRGRVVPHEVEEWEGGQRISVPHFTHSSMWRCMSMDSVFTH